MNTYEAIVYDLGDVLFSWSVQTKSSIPSELVKQILSSEVWQDYERGYFAEDECYKKISEAFDLDALEVKKAIQDVRQSLKVDNANISKEEYVYLRKLPADWNLFEHVFVSGDIGMREPGVCFYEHVLKNIGVRPEKVIFVDEKLENVMSAQSLGMKGIQFQDPESLAQILENLLGDSVRRGEEFLMKNTGKFHSVSDNGVEILENFSQLLILDITHDESLVQLKRPNREWKFFIEEPRETTKTFPNDLDTTSTALRVLPHKDSHINFMLDKMLKYVTAEGLVQTYFDNNRPRFDPIVNINVLHIFHKYSRGQDLSTSMNWVRQILYHRAYLAGTRYYPSPDAILYFFTRLWEVIDDPNLKVKLRYLLTERTIERKGVNGTALCIAMRLSAGHTLGVQNKTDLETLRMMQHRDGGWEAGHLYKFGSSDLDMGNRGLATALAVQVMREGAS
ncbi:hypothetical protein PENSTE_c006G05661 [Penicillium steckii]|uniref:Uncharacterized protein n=1 Tax=Penicillium steckii TaxID=303698 RepID=A0A1V6TGT5_9EURO|nr:hypothetical protein PENSTE_c006G05661 [Penicillium steckii]